jgi:DNA-binding transcriptional MerR regulator
LDKAPDAFRTISEVADDLDVPQHVLRFWETRFTQIRPMKRSGGRRYYRPDDVALLRGIRHLLYGEGYTIRGVQRILREQGVAVVQNAASGVPLPSSRAPDITETTEDQLLDASEEEDEEELDDAEAADEADEDEEEDETDDEPTPRAPVVSVAPANALSRDDIRKLEAALHELSECRRLLDEALNA